MLKNVFARLLKRSRQELWFYVIPNVHCCSLINKIDAIHADDISHEYTDGQNKADQGATKATNEAYFPYAAVRSRGSNEGMRNYVRLYNKTRRVIDIKNADLIVIIGPISEKMAIHIETIYKAIAQKKYILKVGTCDPIFRDFSINLKSKIPVDFEINACPCHPKLLNDTLEKIREMVYFKNPVIA